jgi:hypothetical protein
LESSFLRNDLERPLSPRPPTPPCVIGRLEVNLPQEEEPDYGPIDRITQAASASLQQDPRAAIPPPPLLSVPTSKIMQLPAPKTSIPIKRETASHSGLPWTPEELKKLRKGIKLYGRNIKQIKEHCVTTRSCSAISSKRDELTGVLQRKKMAKLSDSTREQWSDKEIEILIKAVKCQGLTSRQIFNQGLLKRSLDGIKRQRSRQLDAIEAYVSDR